MKRFFVLLLALAAGHNALAQTDLRAVYNFAPDAPVTSAIVESWAPDNWGDTYLNAGFGFKATPFSIYTGWLDVARNFNFWHNVPILKDFSIQAEFNGRTNMDNFNALFGISYTLPMENNVLRASVLYKTFSGGATSLLPMQLTLLWRLYDIFGVQGLDFRGTARGWGEVTKYWYGDDKPMEADPDIFIITADPQIWYSVGQYFGAGNLSVGGEVELSYNWLGRSGFHIRPSAGIKIQF